ncbi:hypothetical protein Pta6605_22230 [Pseudomonas amygdali pv. tabaci]|nr:hypothetical protein Pta6605_22230 [Pseudomonas amygdali pv. tabaci]
MKNGLRLRGFSGTRQAVETFVRPVQSLFQDQQESDHGKGNLEGRNQLRAGAYTGRIGVGDNVDQCRL